MSKRAAQLKNIVNKFHNGESGLETLQVILVLAIGAIISIGIYQFGGQAVQFLWDCFYGSVSE